MDNARWLGASVVTAGLSAALLSGAGVAAATDEAGSTADGAASSSDTSSPDRDTAADVAGSDTGDDTSTSEPSTEPEPEADDEDPTELADPAEPEDPTEPEEPVDAEPTAVADPEDPVRSRDESGDDLAEPVAQTTPEPVRRIEVSVDAEPSVQPEVVTPEIADTATVSASEFVDVSVPAATAEVDVTPVAEASFVSTPVLARAAVAPTAAMSPLSALASAISTLIFNLYTVAARVLSGPPQRPPGSTVTVRSTSLQIDCGDGYTVPADWYIPAGAAETPPQRLIYLQHGFLGSGAWYSYTAANLAERTNSIVVATSISSNPLPCDGCALNGDAMRRAIADLFRDDNTALVDSARRAGYLGELPDRVVLVGHSAGGGLAVETAGYMIDNGTVGRLAGVLMLDGVPSGNEITDTLSRPEADFPVYNLAAEPYSWNRNGIASSQLVAARPGAFNGAQVVGGLHSDSVQGGNPLIQFGVYLATGFSKANNVEAVQTLAAEWVDDMFDGTDTPGTPGSTIVIPTNKGEATAIVLGVTSPAVSSAAV